MFYFVSHFMIQIIKHIQCKIKTDFHRRNKPFDFVVYLYLSSAGRCDSLWTDSANLGAILFFLYFPYLSYHAYCSIFSCKISENDTWPRSQTPNFGTPNPKLHKTNHNPLPHPLNNYFTATSSPGKNSEVNRITWREYWKKWLSLVTSNGKASKRRIDTDLLPETITTRIVFNTCVQIKSEV